MEEAWFIKMETACGGMVAPDQLWKNPGRFFYQLVFLLAGHPAKGACPLLLSSWPNLLHHLLSLFLEVVLKFPFKKC